MAKIVYFNQTTGVCYPQAKVNLQDKSRVLGEAVAKARPYFDSLKKARVAKQRTQFLANQYTRAQQVLRASRELVKASEEKMMACGLKTEEDMQWLEMLNEANDKANEVCDAPVIM